MSNIKIVLNTGNIQSLLLRGEGITGVCLAQAQAIAARAGTGYAVDTYQGKTRVNCSVQTDDISAYQDNLDNNTLLKSMGE